MIQVSERKPDDEFTDDELASGVSGTSNNIQDIKDSSIECISVESTKKIKIENVKTHFSYAEDFSTNITFLAKYPKIFDLVFQSPSLTSNDVIKCEIVRVKHKLPEFNFYIERFPNVEKKERNIFPTISPNVYHNLLVMKSKFKIKPKYFCDYIDLIEKIDGDYTSQLIGKLKSSLLRTTYSLYREDTARENDDKKELIKVKFDYSLKRYGKPTNMLVKVSNDDNKLELVNREPVFDPANNNYKLNFNGRAIKPSTNNVQIIDPNDPKRVIFQLGKYDEDVYKCDYMHPFNAFMAFGMALSVINKRDFI